MEVFCSLILTIFLIFAFKTAYNYCSSNYRRKKLFSRLEVCKAARLQKIESYSKYKSTLPEDIKQKLVKSDAITLLSLLNKGEVTSYDLLLVFFERAITIGLKLRALAEINIEAAIEQAKQCDRTRQELLKTNPSKINELPPLFGLPISVKSNIMVKGLPTNLGCVSFMDNISKEDGFILQIIKKQGAIPFITSSVPQCLFTCETINRVYGRCLNPWNEERTSGGSSGGESSLIASGCSPLGIGSDIGGSVRIPCLYTGLYGIKVTANRITYDGTFCGNKSNKRGQINVKSSHGPMGKSTEDIALFLKSLLVKEMWEGDPDMVPLPWDEKEYRNERKLRIGYVENDSFFAVSPGNQRAVQMAAKSLELSGHEVIKLEFPNFEEATIQYFAVMSSFGKFRPYLEMMGDEPPIEEYSKLIALSKIPKVMRKFIAFILKLVNENRAAKLLSKSYEKSSWEYIKESENQQVIKKQFFNWWKSKEIDALITPGLPSPAIKHGESSNIFLSCSYTFFFNLLDFPTGCIPITTVKEEEQVYIDPKNNDKNTKLMKESLKGSKGLPLGVQITTLPYQEELCCNVMRQIEKHVDFHQLPIKFE